MTRFLWHVSSDLLTGKAVQFVFGRLCIFIRTGSDSPGITAFMQGPQSFKRDWEHDLPYDPSPKR